MKRRFNRNVILLTAAVLTLSGCAEDALVPADPEFDEGVDSEALEQALEAIADELGVADDGDIGILDDSDEASGFGSDAFRDAFGRDEGEREVEGDLADDPELTDRVRADEVHIYHVMAVWGRIQPNPDVRWSPLRWDPALQVMEGDGVRVRRELRFERGDRVHPQSVRNEVLMSSVTGPGVDGVVFQVAITAADAADAYLRFRSLPFSVEIPVRELAELNQTHLIDRTGNGLMLTALRRPPTADPCAAGFMGGRWAATHENGGVFGGVWRQENGRRAGHLAGRWGVTASGQPLFHGKIVNNQGEFLAFLAGEYGDGAYRGEIYGRGGNLLGHVRGHYAVADGGGHGLFRGAWQQVCETDEDDPTCRVSTDGRLEACEPVDRPPIDRPTDERPTDERPTDERPTDERPTDETDGPNDRPTTDEERPDETPTDTPDRDGSNGTSTSDEPTDRG